MRRWLFAKIYDPFMRGPEDACLRTWRTELLAEVHGRVLEIGAGTGSSVGCYPASVEQLVLDEPDAHMRKQLQARVAGQPGVEVGSSGADRLEHGDDSFDFVFSSLVLCSVPDLPRSLAEIRRVLVPGGRLVFLEHVADDERPDRLRWQRRLEPLWKQVAAGCHLTRRTHEAIEAAGLRIESLERESIRKANPLTRRSIRGTATKPH